MKKRFRSSSKLFGYNVKVTVNVFTFSSLGVKLTFGSTFAFAMIFKKCYFTEVQRGTAKY